MPDIIRLLPDAIANQIAAGEVIQRPASVVKELLENSVDAGATKIQLIVKDAGRTLVQVIDNGKGMTESDARMAFERHATSKIKDINDLFSLYTMGFRGEAMASIGAVAHVELKTKTPDHELGTCIIMEGSKVVLQEAAAHPTGTSISVRNLFYNVPARRNFLKSNPIETKHILEEFMHVALANPQIYFTLHHNNMEVYHLRPGNLRQRIVGVFGKSYNEKLVPVEETTDYVSVRGFIGKPDIAKKTRGEQFFFVNNRFIKNNFLNHAISKAYEGLIADKSFPFYCLFIDINPASIDINVHPTKQEIKFEDEKAIYLLLHAAAKHGLSQYSVMPTIDFEHESTFSQLVDEKVYTQQPFKVVQSRMNGGQAGGREEFRTQRETSNFTHWEKLYAPEDVLPPDAITVQSRIDMEEASGADEPSLASHQGNLFQPVQLHGRYILTQIKSGFILIDQQRAHQRIRFERYLQYLSNQPANTQQTLFPKTLSLNPADGALLDDLLPELRVLGFDIQPFGNNTFVVHGLPADLVEENETKLIEDLLEQFKRSGRSEGFDKRQQVARSLAYQTAITPGTPMDVRSMQVLIDDLFACEQPNINPAGLPTFISYTFDELNDKFGS